MTKPFWNWMRHKLALPGSPPVARKSGGLFTTDYDLALPVGSPDRARALARARQPELHFASLAPMLAKAGSSVGTMDSSDDVENSIKGNFGAGFGFMSDAIALWYSAQGFIGYQFCAILAQHWLIEKACKMPAEDAVRNGYEIVSTDGKDIDPKIFDRITDLNEQMTLTKTMIDYVTFARIFGIRVALFVVDSDDDKYYEKPFNIDGVKPGTYKGISQIDPYWMAPQLTATSANTPGRIDFYTPDYWICNSTKIHKSHLCIYVPYSVADVLKPSYYFGGPSVPQRIYERVYAAERTANEAPQLAMTKRLTVMYTDLEKAIADQTQFDDRMSWWIQARDNYGVKFNGTEDKIEQHDTSLAELDNVTMTQYQIVAAAAEVPGTKLMGTQPKGFNSTGDYEEASYHEKLESIETEALTPLIRRHHQLIIKSYIMPEFSSGYFTVKVKWNELDAMTAIEQANVNLIKAQVDTALALEGAIDAQDIRNRIINDPDSGYNGLKSKLPPMPDATELDANGNIKPPPPRLPRTVPNPGH